MPPRFTRLSFFAGGVALALLAFALPARADSYLALDGGFEGSATIDNSITYGTPQAGTWAKANATQTIAKETTIVRSGANSLKINNSSTTGRRLWSPNVTVGSHASSVTIQYYRYVTSTANTQQNQEGITNNTEGLQGTYDVPASAGTWEKQTYTKSSATFVNVAGIIMHRATGTGGDMYIDDMCLYDGSVDTTAPDAPTSPSITVASSTSLIVSWTAPGTGVDSGGYLVVRGTSDPTTAPNTNGIYAVNNTVVTGQTVVHQGASTSFTDTGLTTGTKYYYRIYTYDKAYNYSTAITGNGTPASSCTAPTITGNPSPAEVCVGSPAQFTGSATGATSYKWRKNGVDLIDTGTISGSTTTNLTVTPSGTGDSGAAYTMAAIQSSGGPCSNITSSATLTVDAASVGGTATPTPASVCSGSTSSIGLAGNTGSIVKWQYSSDNFSTSNDIASTANPYTTAALTATTYFRAVVTNGVCASANSSVATVTISGSVTPSVSIAVTSGSNPTCPSNAVTFTATPTNGGGTPTYVWKTNSVVVASATGNTFTETAPVNGETIDCQLTSSASCASPTTANATPITITVSAVATPTATAATAVGSDGFTANWNVATCATGYKLDVATDNGFSSFVTGFQDVAIAGTSTNVTGLTVSTPYYYRVRAVGASGTSGNSGTITVTTLSTPIVLAGWDVNTVSNYGPSPFPATIASGNVTVGGLTRASGVVTNGTAAARAWGGLDWVEANSSDAIASNRFVTFTITPNAGATVSFTAISKFDYRRSGTGAATGTVQYATDGATFHDITNVVYSSTSSSGASLGSIPLSGFSDLQNVPAGTNVTFRIINFGATGSGGTWYIFDVGSSTSNDFEVVGNVSGGCTSPPITTQPTDQTVCAGSAATYTVATSASSPTYQWRLNGDSLANGGTISGYNLATLTVTPTSSSQSVAAGAGYDCVVSASGCSSNSARRALTVYDTSVGGTATPTPASVCSGSASSIGLSGNTGAITKWQYSSDNFASDVNDIASTNNPYSTATLTATTYFRAFVQNGVCTAATSSVAQVSIAGSVTPSVSIAITSGSNPTCAGIAVTVKATPTNGGSSPSYVWKTNSVVVTSVTGDTFTETTPVNGETIDCQLTSSEPCASPTTANATPIKMTVNALATPTASAATGITDTGFTANWGTATCATSYKLDVATDNGFSSFITGYQDVSVAGTSTNVTGLTASTPYYYRVRSVGASGTSTNSGTVTVTTLATPVVLAAWDTSLLPGGTNNFGPTPYAATTTEPTVTVGGLTRGSGVGTNGIGAARAWGGNNWQEANASDAVSSNRYATFTITPNAGAAVSFTAISKFNYRRSGTGAASGVLQYATNGTTFTDIASLSYPGSTSAGAVLADLPIVLSGISALQGVTNGTTVTFRIVNYGATSSAGTWYIFDVGSSTTNDFEVVGTVSGGCPAITLTPSSPLPDGTVGTSYNQTLGASGGAVPYTFSVSSGTLPDGLTLSTSGVVSGTPTNAGLATFDVAVTDSNSCPGTQTYNLTINCPAITQFAVTGGGAYCAGGSGVAVGLAGSQSGVNYQLQLNSINTNSPVAGTGSALAFGNQTLAGTYTVIATYDTSTCTNSMTGSATVSINSLPSAFSVTGGGAYCAGGSGVAVGLAGSQSGVNYQLQLNSFDIGSLVAGTGSALSFSNQTAAGTYTVVATDGTSGCSAPMTGSATVTVNSLPSAPTAGSNSPINVGDTLNLTASTVAGATYSWTGPNGFTSTAQNSSITNATAAASGTYFVTVTDGNGCTSAAASTTVLVNALRATALTRAGSDIYITWIGNGGTTNQVQVTSGLANGSYSTNSFLDIPDSLTILPGSGAVAASYTDVGGATNKPARYYRVRLVP